MPTQEKAGATRRPMSKTAFVLSLPADTPAKEVVERAKRNNMKISDKYVYVVRSNAKRKAGARKGRGRQADGGLQNAETRFRKLAVELGLGKAEALLEDTRRRVANAIG